MNSQLSGPLEAPRTTIFKTTLRTNDAGSAFGLLARHRAHSYGCPDDVEPVIRRTMDGLEYTFEWPQIETP